MDMTVRRHASAEDLSKDYLTPRKYNISDRKFLVTNVD